MTKSFQEDSDSTVFSYALKPFTHCSGTFFYCPHLQAQPHWTLLISLVLFLETSPKQD